MASGLSFIREQHIRLGKGLVLPDADIPGDIYEAVMQQIAFRPELEGYLLDFLQVDLFLFRHHDLFVLILAKNKSKYFPSRGIDKTYLVDRYESLAAMIDRSSPAVDITSSDLAAQAFGRLGWVAGIAIMGIYKEGYDEEARKQHIVCAAAAANIVVDWSIRRKMLMDNSKIFLSHKGVNKPLIESVDKALRLINLKTWFDREDMQAGENLLRSIDAAFPQCSAVVFFVTGQYVDEGILAREVDRAEREALARPAAFSIIPLVLLQHGGTDDRVPSTLRSLVWKQVNDIDIVPQIIRGLPTEVKSQIKFNAPR